MFLAAFLLASVVSAQTKNDTSSQLANLIQPLIDRHQGDVGVAIKNLSGPGEFRHRDDQPMATASLIKLPLMVATYQMVDQGDLDLSQMIELTADDKVAGSGILTPHFSPGVKLPLVDAIRLMIRYSDNTATNLVAEQAGLSATAQSMEKLGLVHTKLHSKLYNRDSSIYPERSQRFGIGSTSAAEMICLLQGLHERRIASEASCEAMIGHLLSCENQDKMPAGLPPGTKIAHKTGAITRVRTDAGIVYGPKPGQAFAICILTENNEDRRWFADSAPNRLIASIAGQAYDTFYGNESTGGNEAPKELKSGAFGKLVESLQRTLNARMTPSPGLSVDGDFGPNTEAAVVRFQESKQLEPSGVVDKATFEALGTLIDQDDPVDPPEALNQNWPKKSAADQLDGVPFVTAKAWVIVDAENANVIAGENHQAARPMASTTKLMTAMVLSELAKHDADLWQQTITFSQRADETKGSTAAVRAGESLSAGELIYGLMLPSGNDASVAFAEHFGGQQALLAKAFPEAQWTSQSDHDRFVEAMNHLASRLEMKHTRFVNPHGLTEPDHAASATDLAKLAVAAIKRPVLQKVVATPQYGVTVTGNSGYQRNLAWYNTNRLLKIDGYQGVKTGTTGAAGACLIAKGSRGEKSRIVVVLGSASSDSRYADTRNLFRWSWNQHP